MTLETDGASKGNPGPSGAGYVLSAGGKTVARGKEHLGVTTNNVAEYRAMSSCARFRASIASGRTTSSCSTGGAWT
jgi:ribonuclease HI